MPTDRPQVIRNTRLSRRWAMELLWRLAVNRVNTRYRETVFGFGWIFLQPVALTLVFTYIFHRFTRISSGVPYPLFSATGLIAWSLTSLVVSQSVIILTSAAPLLKRVALPKILLPLSVVVAVLADLCVMAVLLGGLLMYYRITLTWIAAWTFPLLIVHLAFLVGVSCLASVVTVYVRDLAQAVNALLQLWFFASPVFYPISLVPSEFRALAVWNPMAGLIEGYRSVLLFGQPPSADLLGPAVIVTVILLVLGLWAYRSRGGSIVDLL